MILRGIPDWQRHQATELYWEAFGRKLQPALRPAERGIAWLESTLVCDRALVAVDGDELVGLVGFQLDGHALVELRARDLLREFGVFGGTWRSLLLALLDRKPRPGELLMDGIAVHPGSRGRGFGTELLNAVIALAHDRGLERVRLDVVDTNPAAQPLYERVGFVATRRTKTPSPERCRWSSASRPSDTTCRRAASSRSSQERRSRR